MQLLSFIFFIVLVFLVFYLPGRFILKRSEIKTDNPVIGFTSSVIIGISMFLLGTYILSWFGLEIYYNLFVPLAIFFEYRSLKKEAKQYFENIHAPSIEYILILIGSILMSYLTWNSGIVHKDGLYFYGVNGADSIYHLALIGSLISHFPPFHPGLSGISLHGYNFFYDFLISNFAKFYNLNVFDLFFRNFSFLISLLYGLSSLSLARFLKWRKTTTLIFIFLMYFAQSFDFFAYYVFRVFNFYYNSSGITQSLGNILDPSIVLATAFMFIGFIIFFSKQTKWSFLISVLIIGVIPQIKIYSGILFYAGLAAVALVYLFKTKSPHYIFVLLLSGLVSALVYLPLNYGAGGLIFAPLVIYKNFIDSAWIFNNWHWNVNFIIYAQNKNYLHISYFYFVAILIFVLTGLGIRISVLLYIKDVFKRKMYSLKNIFFISAIVFSFLIPSFFVQSVSSFSVIQFFWVGYILLLIPTAIALGSKLESAGKLKILILISILVVLVLPDTAKTIYTYSANPGKIDIGLVRQSFILSKVPQSDGILIANRIKIKNKFTDVFASPLFSALSGHSIYFEHELTEFQGIGKIVDERMKNVEQISANIESCKNVGNSEQNIINVMNKTNNKYLLVLKKSKCLSQFSKLKVINDEKESILYKI